MSFRHSVWKWGRRRLTAAPLPVPRTRRDFAERSSSLRVVLQGHSVLSTLEASLAWLLSDVFYGSQA
jgi:hypothetical protein